MKNIDLKTLTLTMASDLLNSGEITSQELCSLYLERTRELEPVLKAFITLDEDTVLKQAQASDDRRKKNKTLGEYDGIPIALKDLIAVKGESCTCGSKILSGLKSVYDATAVIKLREQGIVLFGRNNMDEFAMGSTCENSSYYPTKNPWDLERVPGGSSGGSATAVAASEVTAAIGSDTGGSVRQPAAFCGVVGLKPTYGRISRFGLTAYASSLDQLGPITKNVQDASVILDMISGHDIKDATSLPLMSGLFHEAVLNSGNNLKNIRIGIPKEYILEEGLDDEVSRCLNDTVAVLKELGAEIVDISLPHTKYAIASYYVIATAEASTNLARFDGIRYGARKDDADDLMKLYLNTRGDGFGNEVKRRILLGTFVLSSGYYDAYYLKAQKVRTLIKNDFTEAYKKCDVILSPASPCPPFKIGDITDPVQMYLADIYTISVNLAGICAISVPAGLTNNSKLPLGVQFIGPAMGECNLLKTAKIFEDNRKIKTFTPEDR